jgi:hypothetical protein
MNKAELKRLSLGMIISIETNARIFSPHLCISGSATEPEDPNLNILPGTLVDGLPVQSQTVFCTDHHSLSQIDADTSKSY